MISVWGKKFSYQHLCKLFIVKQLIIPATSYRARDIRLETEEFSFILFYLPVLVCLVNGWHGLCKEKLAKKIFLETWPKVCEHPPNHNHFLNIPFQISLCYNYNLAFLERLATRFWRFAHLDTRVLVRSFIYVRRGGLAHSQCSNSSQKCLVGLKPGICAGHSSSHTKLWQTTSIRTSICAQRHCHAEAGSGFSSSKGKIYYDNIF